MRVAAAVIGGLGAVFGVLKGSVLVLGTLFFGSTRSGGFNSYLFLWTGTEGGIVVSCLAGAVGSGFALAGRSRVGTSLMLVGATGVVLDAVAYWLLLPLTQPPDYRTLLGTFPMDIEFYILWLFPVPFLLVGAALAFFTRDRANTREAA